MCTTVPSKRIVNNHIIVLADSHAAIKATSRQELSYSLVWECHQCFVELSGLDQFELRCVLGHRLYEGNEKVDELAMTFLIYLELCVFS